MNINEQKHGKKPLWFDLVVIGIAAILCGIGFFLTFHLEGLLIWSCIGLLLLAQLGAIRRWEPEKKFIRPDSTGAVTYAIGFSMIMVSFGFVGVVLSQPEPYSWITLGVILLDGALIFIGVNIDYPKMIQAPAPLVWWKYVLTTVGIAILVDLIYLAMAKSAQTQPSAITQYYMATAGIISTLIVSMAVRRPQMIFNNIRTTKARFWIGTGTYLAISLLGTCFSLAFTEPWNVLGFMSSLITGLLLGVLIVFA